MMTIVTICINIFYKVQINYADKKIVKHKENLKNLQMMTYSHGE